jgi:hypothetical protein
VTGRCEQLAPGLWRWTAPHPAWRPGDDRPGGWERDVGSVLYALGDTVTVVDPLVGPDDDAVWRFLDERAGAARSVVVALTAPWHRRSAAESPALRSRDELHMWLRALDRLPVRLVVPSHGPPVSEGRAAIRRALELPPWGAGASA